MFDFGPRDSADARDDGRDGIYEEYCRREGYEVLERFKEEGESAKTTDRTELQNLLKYCRTQELTLTQIDRHSVEVEKIDVAGILAFAERVFTEGVGLVGAGVAESARASSAAVFPRGHRVRRKTVCSNRGNRQRVQILDYRGRLAK